MAPAARGLSWPIRIWGENGGGTGFCIGAFDVALSIDCGQTDLPSYESRGQPQVKVKGFRVVVQDLPRMWAILRGRGRRHRDQFDPEKSSDSGPLDLPSRLGTKPRTPPESIGPESVTTPLPMRKRRSSAAHNEAFLDTSTDAISAPSPKSTGGPTMWGAMRRQRSVVLYCTRCSAYPNSCGSETTSPRHTKPDERG